MDASMTLHRARVMNESRGNHAGWPMSHARGADASVDIHMGVRAVALAHHATSVSGSREIPARIARVQRENQTDSCVDEHGSTRGCAPRRTPIIGMAMTLSEWDWKQSNVRRARLREPRLWDTL
jgi:hypothetical protein